MSGGLGSGYGGGGTQRPLDQMGMMTGGNMSRQPLDGFGGTGGYNLKGGAMPYGGGGGMAGSDAAYADYMNRWRGNKARLDGMVASPGGGLFGQQQSPNPYQPWPTNGGMEPSPSGGTWGGAPPSPTPATSAPPATYTGPKAAAAGGGGPDHMANLRMLMGEDPRLASEYRLRSGDTIDWWQQNQNNVAQQLFGGDNARMQEWLRGSSPVSSNAAPLTTAEMMRLNGMAGISGPSWLK